LKLVFEKRSQKLRITRILLPVLIIIAAIFPCLSAQPAQAAALLTLTPNHGGLSTPVTIIGAGFPASTAVAVKIDGAALWSGTTLTDGSFSVTSQVNSTAPGVRNITAVAGAGSAGAVFTVMAPYMSVTPDAGGEGIPIQINGNYFLPGTAFTVLFEQTVIASGTTNIFGYLSAAGTVPAGYSGGSKKITLSVGGVTATVYFTLYYRLVTLAPAQGMIGSVFVVSGTYWVPDTSVSIQFEGVTIGSGRVALNGGFAIQANIPSGYRAGEKKITITSGSVTETRYYTIVPGQLSISPQTGVVGTGITVQGNGFNFRDAVTVYYNNAEVAKTTSSSSGNISVNLTVPVSPAGGSFIRAVDSHDIAPLPVKFSIIPTVEITGLMQGTVGATVNITGSGFTPDAVISVTLEGADWKQNVTSDSQGSIQSSFEVLNITGGAKRVVATDAWGQMVTSGKTFIVEPSVAIGPVSSGSTGTAFTVYGKGFSLQDQELRLYFGRTFLGSVQCDRSGSFEYSGIAPELAAGDYVISVQNAYGKAVSVSTVFKILPEAQIGPDNGFVGMPADVGGRGFLPGTDIDLIWDFPPVSQIIAKTNADGTFAGVFTIPECLYGIHNAVISDGVNTAGVSWFMENNPPPAPPLTSPVNGERIGQFDGQTPTFQWGAVTDLSGVLYRLTISADAKFSQVILTKDNLAGTAYTLDKSESLKRGIYYWRITAVDGAGNESREAASFSIQIGTHLLEWLVDGFVLLILAILAVLYHMLVGFTNKRKLELLKVKEELLKKQVIN
jgi:hypothetical protein